MENGSLLQLLLDLRFWIGTVIVGFLINIAASFAKPWMEGQLAHFSEKQRLKNSLKREKLTEALVLLNSDPGALQELRQSIITRYLRLLTGFGLSILLSSLLPIPIGQFIALIFLLSYFFFLPGASFSITSDLEFLLHEYHDRQQTSVLRIIWGDTRRGLQIHSAYYGAQGKTKNVTRLLKSKILANKLTVTASNEAMGGDPLPNNLKQLTIEYYYHGQRFTKIINEHDTAVIPD